MKKIIIGILAMTCLLCGTGQIVASAAENSDISGLTGNFTVDSNGSTDSPDKIRVNSDTLIDNTLLPEPDSRLRSNPSSYYVSSYTYTDWGADPLKPMPTYINVTADVKNYYDGLKGKWIYDHYAGRLKIYKQYRNTGYYSGTMYKQSSALLSTPMK
ncbi:hypothetical protein [Enterococcus sp. S86.2]|uniref:hypothetical protein n=1 Tax=Enterococcus sp. S86.2 TaxID=3031299 RepID=UPI0026F17910|nr:hypothetical protein [Enterococcus sp. S86.2]